MQDIRHEILRYAFLYAGIIEGKKLPQNILHMCRLNRGPHRVLLKEPQQSASELNENVPRVAINGLQIAGGEG